MSRLTVTVDPTGHLEMPEPCRLVVEVPETVRPGRARLILLESPQKDGETAAEQEGSPRRGE